MEANPNPNSMKFVVNFMLLQDGVSFDYPNVEAAADSPLAHELFKIEGVERVFYMSNFITVTKVADLHWIELQEAIKAVIKPYLENDKPLILQELDKDPLFDENDSEVVKQIKLSRLVSKVYFSALSVFENRRLASSLRLIIQHQIGEHKHRNQTWLVSASY
jgi:hypothetical protein